MRHLLRPDSSPVTNFGSTDTTMIQSGSRRNIRTHHLHDCRESYSLPHQGKLGA